MCSPTAVFTVVSLLYTADAQAKAAQAQAEAIDIGAEQRAEEQGNQLQQELGERQAQARREQARMIVAQGESGLQAGSASFEAQLANSFAAENRASGVLKENADILSKGIAADRLIALSNVRSKREIFADAATRIAGASASFEPKPKTGGLQIPTE